MNLTSRIRAAWGLIAKGSVQPFDRIPVVDSVAGDQIKRPYAQSVWVMRAIKKVAQPIAAVPLEFSADSRNGEQEITDPTLTQFWSMPARGLGLADFVEAITGWLKLEGEAFLLLDDSLLIPASSLPFPEAGRTLPPLIVARPDRMSHLVKGRQLLGWQFTDAEGRGHNLLPQQVIQIKLWNPYDEWRGLSELEAALVATDADYLAGKYNLNLMRNNGDRGPIIAAKNPVSDEQKEQIIAQLRQKARAAASGNFKAIFLTGDVTVEDPKVQALDAAMISTRLENRHEIFIAFGVPPSMADVQASYSIGSASDRFALIEETCMPTAEKIADGIEQASRRMTGNANLFAWFDWDEHSTMQQVRSERIDAAVKLWGLGMPVAQANDYLRMGMKPFTGWDQGYLPFSVTPVGTEPSAPIAPGETMPAAQPMDQGEMEDDGSMKSRLKTLFHQRSTITHQLPDCPCCGGLRLIERAGATEHERDFNARARLLRDKLKAFFFEQRGRVLKKFLAQAVRQPATCSLQPATSLSRAPFEDLFDFEEENRLLIERVSKLIRADFEAGALKLFTEIGKSDFKLPPTAAIDYLNVRENFITGINETTFDGIRTSLQDGLLAGDTQAQLVDRVRAVFNDASQRRAETIAATEVNTALNTGRHEGMTASGVKKRAWKCTSLPNVRPTHIAAQRDSTDGIPMDVPFQVGAFQLMHPGDSSLGAPPNETINCRCFTVPILD